jgi:hypothetical protein
MAGANSNIQMTDLDFNNIKTNLKTFLKSQDTLKDYNYEGSALSTLLDVLAYNTQYNAYYLNQVANEMFLDTAIQRGSVVSQAKLLDYVPKSSIAPRATINLTVNDVADASLTLPKFTTFMSEAIDGINYNFVTADSQTVNVSANTAIFENVILKQGIPASISFTVDSTNNPSYTFEIPESNVDTSTLTVIVQQSSSNTSSEVYNLASNYLTLKNDSKVYFLQESLNNNYQVYFGDGVLGNKLTDGNIVKLSYIVTQGSSAFGANNFVLMDSISGYSNYTLNPLISATQGGNRESITSVKFQAPKSYAAQSRAVTKEDYITAIQQNKLDITFDAVNVWGGEENDPPVYGQVFISLKPQGGYNLTTTQKQKIIEDVIKPISVLTVTPTIIDPDYTYLKLTIDVVYNPNKTTQTAQQIENGVKTAIQSFANSSLNTFNSTFSAYDMLTAIQNYSSSIVSSNYKIQLQKKFLPNLLNSASYNLYYGTPLEKGILLSGVSSSPSLKFRDVTNLENIIDGVFIEEVPSSTNAVESLSIINPGFSYTATPSITIKGDGTGATAHAKIVNGRINEIVVDTPGTGYTSAIAIITNDASDTTGSLGAAVVNLAGRYGTLRSYYNNTNNLSIKTIFNSNIGTIDYMNGVVTLNSFNPYDVNNGLGQLTITTNPTTSIISSSYNKIITVDPFDSTSIVVNVTAKLS